jgi:uncharacterized protein YdbL (DUF1318 family)
VLQTESAGFVEANASGWTPLPVIHPYRDSLAQAKTRISFPREHFMNDFCNSNQISPKEISHAAAAWLMDQDYPGNVREPNHGGKGSDLRKMTI